MANSSNLSLALYQIGKGQRLSMAAWVFQAQRADKIKQRLAGEQRIAARCAHTLVSLIAAFHLP
jgi:hypothetical protein